MNNNFILHLILRTMQGSGLLNSSPPNCCCHGGVGSVSGVDRAVGLACQPPARDHLCSPQRVIISATHELIYE